MHKTATTVNCVDDSCQALIATVLHGRLCGKDQSYASARPFGLSAKRSAVTALFGPENLAGVLFPDNFNGRYPVLTRPVERHIRPLAICLATSANLVDWGAHRSVLGPRQCQWDSEGKLCALHWMLIYHGADHRHRYCVDAALIGTHDPIGVLVRSNRPLMEPETSYETGGFLDPSCFRMTPMFDPTGRSPRSTARLTIVRVPQSLPYKFS